MKPTVFVATLGAGVAVSIIFIASVSQRDGSQALSPASPRDHIADQPLNVSPTCSAVTLEPGESRNIAAGPLVPPSSQPAHASVLEDISAEPATPDKTLDSSVDNLLSRCRQDIPPLCGEIDALVAALAEKAEVDTQSIELADDGTLKSATLSVPGSDLTGILRYHEGSYNVSFVRPVDEKTSLFGMSELRLSLTPDGTQALAGNAVLQSHPDTRRDANELIREGDIITCGWSFHVGSEGTAVNHIGAKPTADGAWAIGRVDESRTEQLTGLTNLRPYDSWMTKILQLTAH